jgi:hypothetical protein
MEGLEVPVIGATVQVSRSAPATATIQVVPLDILDNLKEQTMVHLFYYDLTTKDYDFSKLENYKLLFMGELVGVGFQSTPSGRVATLRCADFTINWDKVYQYMITYGPNGNVLTPEGGNYGAGDTKFNNIMDGHAAVMLRYLRRTPTSPGLQGLQGLVGGIVSFIEAFGGVDHHTNGVNDFFAISELKNHILQQIVAEDNDNTATSLFSAKEFMEWLERGVTTLGELCRLSDMINMLFNYIYYEYVTNVNPMYTPGNEQFRQSSLNLKINESINEAILGLRDDGIIQNIKERLQHGISILDVVVVLTENEKQKKLLKDALDNMKAIVEETQYSKAVSAKLTSTKKILELSKSKDVLKKDTVKAPRVGSYIFKPECYFVAPPRCNVIFPEHRTQISKDNNMLNRYTRLRLQSGMAFIGNDKLLADYCYAPSRQEVESYAKEQGSYGVRALLPWEVYSGIQPKFEYLNEINYVANKKQRELQKGTVRLIENKAKNKNTGQDNIIKAAVALKQKAANFNFFKARFSGRRMNVNTRFNPSIIAGFPALIINKPFYITDEDIKNVASKMGFSLDKISEQDIVSNIDKLAQLLDAPMHYIGYVDTVIHTVDQSGGTTNCALSYVRTHKITDDDYLQLKQAQVVKQLNTKILSTQYDITDAQNRGDAASIKLLQDLTYQNIEPAPSIKPQIEESGMDAFDITNITKSTLLPKLNISGIDTIRTDLRTKNTNKDIGGVGYTKTREIDGGTIEVPTQYGILAPGMKGPKGTIKEVQIVDSTLLELNGKRSWKTIILYEEVVSKEILKSIPIEEIIRPNWFSHLYSNLYIGDGVYQKYFGSGSIVDQLVFQSQSGLSLQGLADKKAAIQSLSNFSLETTDTLKTPDAKLFDIPSVETAANILAFQYGRALQENADIERFVDDYTSRPVANWVDILGSPDLQYRKVGNQLVVEKGKPGFHSAAVAPFGDLVGLVDNPDAALPSRFGDKKVNVISRKVDPRPGRRKVVEEYVNQLRSTESVVSLEG